MDGHLNKKICCVWKDKYACLFFLMIPLVFLITLCLPGHILAKKWDVDPSDPNKGIKSMINKASFGDIVSVPAGDYHINEEIVLKEGIIIEGVAEDLGSVVIISKPNQSIIRAHSHTSISNLVIRGGDSGITCEQGTTNITISHNLIKKNQYGIRLLGSEDVEIFGNTIVHNYRNGVKVEIYPNMSSEPNRLILHGRDNIIAFNGREITFTFIVDPNSPNPPTLDLRNIFLSYNDLHDKIYRVVVDLNKNQLASNNIGLEPFGPSNFSLDPYFIDTNIEDYHLSFNSPCIDRGDPNSDYFSEPSPNGERMNLGFYGNSSQATQSNDEDKDGVSDQLEGIDDMDADGLPDWLDADTASIPLPWGVKRIPFYIQEISPDPNQAIQLKNTQRVLASGLSIKPPQGILPFDAIQFGVENVNKGGRILVRMVFPEDFEALGISQYIALSTDSYWQTIPFEIDPNDNVITFTMEDGKSGDINGIQDGYIEHLATLVIPQSITLENPNGCFLSLLNPHAFDHMVFYLLKNGSLQKNFFYCFKNKSLFPFILFCFLIGIFGILFLIQNKTSVKRWILILVTFMAIIFLFSHGWAQIKEDIEITSSFNPVGSGSRALGMGGAFIGVADDATAASWNPAGLKHLGKPEISWVEAYSSRNESFRFEKNQEASGEYRLANWDINYLSIAYPFRLFKKNFFVSLNYQHLYDFSKKLAYRWRYFSNDRDINYYVIYEQSGGLRALSPALAIPVSERLTFGLTLNIWSDKFSNNEWIEKYHKDGKGIELINSNYHPVTIHVDYFERYTFSGNNFHVGMLLDIAEAFTLGLVYKTAIRADIEHTSTYYLTKQYPQDASLNKYIYDTWEDKEKLCMPSSYGIGLSYQPIDPLVIDLDVYRTEWGDYEIIKSDGSRINPITGYHKSETTVKPTHQVRLGAEYVFVTTKSLIPALRGGIFYDPAPAPDKPDDYYGVSLGFGVTIREKRKTASRRGKRNERQDIMSIDMAYQYRWGDKVEGKTIKSENSPADVNQHLLYLSIIYYFKRKGMGKNPF